jgi:hypothetical protein
MPVAKMGYVQFCTLMFDQVTLVTFPMALSLDLKRADSG